jgi:hypothetical protein
MRFLELEATFAGCVGECFYFTMIACTAAVEYDRCDAGSFGLRGESGAEGFGPGQIGGEFLLAKLRIERAEKYERRTSIVIDRLCVNVLRGEAHGQTGTESGASDFFTNSPTALLKEIGFANGIHGRVPEKED